MLKGGMVVISAVVLTAGCSSDTRTPTAPISIPVVTQALHGPDASSNANGGNFGTPLSADEEVMPAGVVNNSHARGNATFQLNADGTELSYHLSVAANIANVFQAHIHQGAVGANGPASCGSTRRQLPERVRSAAAGLRV